MGGELTYRQERSLALTPKFTAGFSIPCSVFLIYEVISDWRRGQGSPIKRVLLGMSVIDISSSFAWFLSTWAVPEGGFALSAGNRSTCNFQGFLLQIAIGAPLYNSSLALFYLLIIKYRWTDIMLRSIENWVHIFILSFTWGTSFLLLPMDMYNHIGAVCWIIGDPAECGNSSFQPSDVPCDRGNHAWLIGLLLFYGPLWICVIACCVSMAFICYEVRTTVKRLKRYSVNGRVAHAMGRSDAETSKVAMQAVLYSLSFLVTWMPSTLWSIAHWFNWSGYWLDFAAAFCEPLQGFWNFAIFARNRPQTLGKLKQMLEALSCGLYIYDSASSDRKNSGESCHLAAGRSQPSRPSAETSNVSVEPQLNRLGVTNDDMRQIIDLDRSENSPSDGDGPLSESGKAADMPE